LIIYSYSHRPKERIEKGDDEYITMPARTDKFRNEYFFTDNGNMQIDELLDDKLSGTYLCRQLK